MESHVTVPLLRLALVPTVLSLHLPRYISVHRVDLAHMPRHPSPTIGAIFLTSGFPPNFATSLIFGSFSACFPDWIMSLLGLK